MDKIIIFDMDGTLIDSSKSITKSINLVRDQLGLPPLSVERVVDLINEPDNDLPRLFYEDIKPYSECRAIFEKHYYKNCIKEMGLFDGVVKMLEALRNEHILSVLSNAYGLFARKMIAHTGLSKYFSDIIGSDDIDARKPDPKGIWYLLDKHNIKKENALYIGDSLKDEMAAKNAGIKYAFVEWGFGECKEPDFVINKSNIENIAKIWRR